MEQQNASSEKLFTLPPWRLGPYTLHSRLLMGTGRFPADLIPAAVEAAGVELVTATLRRIQIQGAGGNTPQNLGSAHSTASVSSESVNSCNILKNIPKSCKIIPNTSGARTAREALRMALIGREAGLGDLIKVEIIGEQKYLMPDNEATLEATRLLAREGFVVLPYVSPCPVLARKLEDAGAAAVMPLGSAIGSHRGLKTRELLEMVIESTSLPVIVDAGLGTPSHAAEALEMGATAVLVNSAIACAQNPVLAARAFALAVEAALIARAAGLQAAAPTPEATASSPTSGYLRNASSNTAEERALAP